MPPVADPEVFIPADIYEVEVTSFLESMLGE